MKEMKDMDTLSIVELRNNLADTLNRVAYGGERLVFARRGKPVAALVSPDDLAALEAAEDANDVQAAKRVLREYDRDPAKFQTLDAYKRDKADA
jgi:prevent-host-death family protein